jgi:predicted metalloprotease with PDZ domain
MRRYGLGVSLTVLATVLGAAMATAAPAAKSAVPLPMPAPPSPPIPEPRDIPYPGELTVAIDATDLTHGIFSIKETVPVAAPGPMVLTYPKWLPGNHSPRGAIDKLAGLIVHAGGKRIEWRRDPVDVTAFHIDPPAGAKSVEVEFQFLSAVSTREGRVVMTPEMLNAQFISLALYPAGYFTRDIKVKASIKLPEGWKYATALETERQDGPWAHFKTTTFETLADSPLIAGKYYRQFDLDPGGPARVSLDVIADRPEELDAKPEQILAHKTLVQQAYRVFGSHHYSHYDFLFTLSDKMGGNGLEHHQSSEDGTTPRYFLDWDKGSAGRDLLAHEYTHSWNGKFRRGADLWTPTFNVPMRDSLLWVYEGQTQYWGYVLAARSGLMSRKDTLDAIAMTAATYDNRVGRAWKPLIDTTNDPIVAQRSPLSWLSWQRSEDYYSEGQLIWLDADTLIREKSGGQRSLDDFAKLFFGVDDGSYVPHTYTFDDVVKALNTVQPYDWASFLHTRLEGHGPGAPLDGLQRGGYKLVYTDVQSDYAKSAEMRRKTTDFMYSLGFSVNRDGQLSEVQWDGPAFKAGLTADTQLVAVNGLAYSADDLKQAVKDAKGAGPAVELLVKINDHYRTVKIDWHGGPLYPHLEKVSAGDGSLDAILTPRAS